MQQRKEAAAVADQACDIFQELEEEQERRSWLRAVLPDDENWEDVYKRCEKLSVADLQLGSDNRKNKRRRGILVGDSKDARRTSAGTDWSCTGSVKLNAGSKPGRQREK
jgi:hypothetical protein